MEMAQNLMKWYEHLHMCTKASGGSLCVDKESFTTPVYLVVINVYKVSILGIKVRIFLPFTYTIYCR